MSDWIKDPNCGKQKLRQEREIEMFLLAIVAFVVGFTGLILGGVWFFHEREIGNLPKEGPEARKQAMLFIVGLMVLCVLYFGGGFYPYLATHPS